jgi:hypothetical protein
VATRLYFRENGTAPITPAVDGGWESSASPFARKPCFTTTASDSLTTVTGFTSTAGQDRCHRQLISEPMAAGIVFDTGVTYKCYVQGLESALNDNIKSRLGVRILSQDGGTVRHTVLAIADYSTATEWNTAIRNKAFANGDAGTGSYTTVTGDRLVIEIGHSDTSGASISANSRWGSHDTGVTDLGENETSTSTTERPWFETSVSITFVNPVTIASTTTAETSSGTVGVKVSGTNASTSTAQTASGAVGVKVSGTAASTGTAQTSALEGTVSSSEIEGTLASTNTAQTESSTVGVRVSGATASTGVAQTASGSVGVQVSGVSASTGTVQSSDIVGALTVSGAVASANASQLGALSGSVALSGIVASEATPQIEAVSAGVRISVLGASFATSQTETLSGAALVSGIIASTDVVQIEAGTGGVLVSGVIASVGKSQTCLIQAGSPVIFGDLDSVNESQLSVLSGAVSGEVFSSDYTAFVRPKTVVLDTIYLAPEPVNLRALVWPEVVTLRASVRPL